MGKGTDGVGTRRDAERLEREIRALRDDLDDVVGELDRRRHELFDWKLQVRRHRRGLAWFAGGVLVLIGGFVGLHMWRQRALDRPLGRLQRMRKALARAIYDPGTEQPREPSVGSRMLVRTGGAVTAALGKKLLSG